MCVQNAIWQLINIAYYRSWQKVFHEMGDNLVYLQTINQKYSTPCSYEAKDHECLTFELQVDVEIISSCGSNTGITDVMLWAGVLEGGKDSCQVIFVINHLKPIVLIKIITV